MISFAGITEVINMTKLINIILSFILLFSLCSCNAVNEHEKNEPNINASIHERAPESFKRNSLYQRPEKISNQSLPEEVQHNHAVRAQAISSAIRKMSAVVKASVVINGETAIVGVVVPDDYPDDRLISLKKQIEKKVIQVDSEIKSVRITSSLILADKISGLSEDVTNGTPNSKLNEELENIITRITPAI